MTTEELARRVDADPVRLDRLIRFASVRGWVRVDRGGLVRPTPVTEFLRQDHPGGWRAWVDFAGAPDIVDAVGQLSVIDDGVDGFAAVNGAPVLRLHGDAPGTGRDVRRGHGGRWADARAHPGRGDRLVHHRVDL